MIDALLDALISAAGLLILGGSCDLAGRAILWYTNRRR